MDLPSQNKSSLKHVPEIRDLKDFPIPKCIIKFIDNDVITSISSSESWPETKNEKPLDFYLFRLAAVERPEKDNPLKKQIIKIFLLIIENG